MDILSSMLAIIMLVFLVACHNHFRNSRTKRNVLSKRSAAPEPPGAWPLIGHLHILSGQAPIARILGTMTDKYGPIFSLRLGSRPALVVSSWEMVKECFTTNDRTFATRPSLTVGKYMGYNNAMFALAPYGPYWRDVRKMVTLELLVSQSLQKLKHVRASVKREAINQLQQADDSMEDDDVLSSTTDQEKNKKKNSPTNNNGGSSGKKGSNNSGGGGGGGGGGGASSNMKCCQAEKCSADLSDAKQYHRRHKVCEHHAKAQMVIVGGIRQRFCQQCSRFHELSEFDEAKRSCRRRLAGHNERRRKNSTDSSQAEGSSRKGIGTQMKEIVSGQVDDKGRIQITVQENATYTHFQIR